MEEAPPAAPGWAPARYNPSNLVRVNKADPDDKKFRLLKKLAFVFLSLAFVSALATSATDTFFICVEWSHECTFNNEDEQYNFRNKMVMSTFIGCDASYTLFMAGVFIYILVLYKRQNYVNYTLLYIVLVDVARLIILFIIWAAAASGANIAKGEICESFAITALVICPIAIVIHIADAVVLIMFRRRVVHLNPDLLHGGGPDFVPNVQFTGFVVPGQPPPQQQPYQPAYQEQPPQTQPPQ